MDYLVSYDISSDKKRTRIARILDDYGKRVQESVFELAHLRKSIWDECLSRLIKVNDLKEGESIRVYVLCNDCKSKIIVLGDDSKPMDAPERYVV